MIQLTHSHKNPLLVNSPVLIGAGFAGFDGSPYRRLLSLDKFGALITPPLTLAPRQPTKGQRVVPLPSGFLLHTGLPNPGIPRTIREYESKWNKSQLPIIVHLVAETPESVEQAVRLLEQCPAVAGIELGLHDEVVMREVQTLVMAARHHTDLPLMVQLPLYHAPEFGEAAQHSGAEALVVSAPPRGTARDPRAGRLIGGRLYGSWLKAQTLRAVGRVVQYAEVPVIACGGIHTPEDAQDFIIAGAVAVQLDSVIWVSPRMADTIAHNLSGSDMTSPIVTDDEAWGVPTHLPEMPDDDVTSEADNGVSWLD